MVSDWSSDVCSSDLCAVHARAITAHSGSALVAVSDVVAENAARLADTYGAVVRTSDEIIADPAIDAVLIAT